MEVLQSKKVKRNILLVIGGLFVGIANGLFGGGGGMILVPLLTLVAKLEAKNAHATAIAIILPNCLVTAINYTLFGKIALLSAGFTEIGVIVGGITGALLLKKLSNNVISAVFYLLMIGVGIRMIIG